MAPLCASNQPHSVYPHGSPLIHLCLRPPIYISSTVHYSSGPDAGPFVGLLVGVSINLSVIRQAEEEEGASLSPKRDNCHQTGGSLMLLMGTHAGVKDLFMFICVGIKIYTNISQRYGSVCQRITHYHSSHEGCRWGLSTNLKSEGD